MIFPPGVRTREVTCGGAFLPVSDAEARQVVTEVEITSTRYMIWDGQSTTVTAVHAYADAVRKDYLADTRAMAPGLNPGAVTDDHLLAAVTAVFL